MSQSAVSNLHRQTPDSGYKSWLLNAIILFLDYSRLG